MNLSLISNSSDDENIHALSETETGVPWIVVRFDEGMAAVNPDVKARISRVMIAAAMSALQLECQA